MMTGSNYMGSPGDNFQPYVAADSGNNDRVYAEFNEPRWRRVGATDEEIERLRASHDRRKPENQVAEGKRLAESHDDVLRADLEKARERWGTPDEDDDIDPAEEFSGTVQEVLDKVGDDPEKARAALAYEKDNKFRVSLVSALEAVISAGDSDE